MGLGVLTFSPLHNKTSKMTCVPSEVSDQPGHSPSLIRIFPVRMKKAWVLSYPLSAQRRLWSDWKMPRLIWVFAGRKDILLVLLWGGSFVGDRQWFCSTVRFLQMREQQMSNAKNLLPGPVAWMDVRLTGIQEVAGSVLQSGNILSWRLVLKSFLRPFSPYHWLLA